MCVLIKESMVESFLAVRNPIEVFKTAKRDIKPAYLRTSHKCEHHTQHHTQYFASVIQVISYSAGRVYDVSQERLMQRNAKLTRQTDAA